LWAVNSRFLVETALTTAIEVTGVQPAQTLTAQEFDEVVRRNQRRVYRVLWMLVRNHEEADTLTQECFLRAYQKLSTFRGESSIETWLLKIAVNLTRDAARNRKLSFWKKLIGLDDEHGGAAAAQVSAPQSSPEQALMAREEVNAIWAVVADLSPQQRAVFTLRFVEQMELREIASVLGVRVGSVKSQLFRAVHAVREGLKKQQWRQ
jgi:RNA polymerase sigma-70 factor, ECF subfamily